jgi:propanol-preferring alcohol dehydrogenase
MCLSGNVAYCRAMRGIYGFTRDGFQAEYVRVAESAMLPLPETLTFEQGCLIPDPIGTPYHAHRRIGTDATHTVGVFGLGPMGLGAVAIAVHLGARVIGADPIACRRDLARRLGAADTINPADGSVLDQIRGCTGGWGLDRAVECSGRPDALHAALDALRPFGWIALIGESIQAVIRPSDHFIRKEITMTSAWGFPLGEYAAIVRLCEAGLKTAEIITHRYSIEQAAEAYRTFAEGNTGKVVFVPRAR